MARLFGRKNDKTTIAELEEYYSNQEKNRTPRAWLMALLSLLITVAIVVALFFFGRWLYNVITDNDSDSSNVTNTSQDEELDIFVDTDGSQNDSAAGGSGSGSGEDGSGSDETEGVVSDEAATTENGNVSGAQDDVEITVDEVPETGAEDLIWLLPVAVAVLGYTYSIRKQSKNQ